MRKYLIHGSDSASRYQRICCRQRLSQCLIEDERVSRRPHDDTSWKPALEELGCSPFGLRRGNECRSSSRDRKSTRLNSSHQIISYAVFCLKKKKKCNNTINR